MSFFGRDPEGGRPILRFLATSFGLVLSFDRSLALFGPVNVPLSSCPVAIGATLPPLVDAADPMAQYPNEHVSQAASTLHDGLCRLRVSDQTLLC